jgi:hypothetical protein
MHCIQPKYKSLLSFIPKQIETTMSTMFNAAIPGRYPLATGHCGTQRQTTLPVSKCTCQVCNGLKFSASQAVSMDFVNPSSGQCLNSGKLNTSFTSPWLAVSFGFVVFFTSQDIWEWTLLRD